MLLILYSSFLLLKFQICFGFGEDVDLGAFPFSRLEIQLFDLSKYFILYQWIVA